MKLTKSPLGTGKNLRSNSAIVPLLIFDYFQIAWLKITTKNGVRWAKTVHQITTCEMAASCNIFILKIIDGPIWNIEQISNSTNPINCKKDIRSQTVILVAGWATTIIPSISTEVALIQIFQIQGCRNGYQFMRWDALPLGQSLNSAFDPIFSTKKSIWRILVQYLSLIKDYWR